MCEAVRIILILGILCLSGAIPAQAQSIDRSRAREIYQSGNAAFESGKFEDAIRQYDKLVGMGQAADALYLNLGTAHFRNARPGLAALWFRRAAYLNPGMPEVEQNFAYLRQRQGLLEFAQQDWQKFLLTVSPVQLLWIGWLFFWVALFCLLAVFWQAKRNARPLFVVLAVFAGTVSVLFLTVHFYRANHLSPENFATVIVPGTSALVSPAPDSAPVIELPEGSEVRILENTGPWIYAQIPGDLVGWVHHSSIEANWPIPEKSAEPPPMAGSEDSAREYF